MNVKLRVEKLEQQIGQIRHKNVVPVLCVEHKKEIELYRNKIGPRTVVIIDDVDELDKPTTLS